MLYMFIGIGVALLLSVPYLAIKGKNAPDKQKLIKGLSSIAIIGVHYYDRGSRLTI